MEIIKQTKVSWRELTPYLAMVLVAILAIGTTKQLIKKHQLNKELAQLQEAANSIKQENLELENFLTYVQSSTFTEEQARLQFGLAAPGEKLAVIPQVAGISDDTDDDNSSSIDNFKTFWTDWWNHFFGKNKAMYGRK